MIKNVFLGLGSNLGDREKLLTTSITLLSAYLKIQVQTVSSFIETQAISDEKQPPYLNACVKIATDFLPLELFQITVEIEKNLGRVTKGDKKPRPIDIDLLFYDQQVICEEDLIVPHPLLHERFFVLTPLKEIAPNFIHPVLEETVTALYDDLLKQ